MPSDRYPWGSSSRAAIAGPLVDSAPEERSMSRVLVALIALAVLLAGVAWFVASPQDVRAPLAPRTPIAPMAAAPVADATLVDAAPGSPSESPVGGPPAIERAAARTATE